MPCRLTRHPLAPGPSHPNHAACMTPLEGSGGGCVRGGPFWSFCCAALGALAAISLRFRCDLAEILLPISPRSRCDLVALLIEYFPDGPSPQTAKGAPRRGRLRAAAREQGTGRTFCFLTLSDARMKEFLAGAGIANCCLSCCESRRVMLHRMR